MSKPRAFGRRLGQDHDHSESGEGGDELSPSSVSAGGLEVTNETLVVVEMNSDQNIPAGSWSTVELDSVQKDERGEFDSTTFEFTPDETGYYTVLSQVRYNSPSDSDRLRMEFRDADGNSQKIFTSLSAGGAALHTPNLARAKELSAGTAYDLRAQNVDSDDTIKASNAQTFLTIRRAYR